MKSPLFFCLLPMLVSPQLRGGYIHGTVMSADGAVVPGVRVEATSSVGSCQTTSNAEGKFNCSLPADTYTIEAKGVNTIPYRRATVRVTPSGHTYVVIRPIWVAPSDQTTVRDPVLQYQSQPLADGMNVLVQFESKEERTDAYRFRGKYTMLTFHDVAVYAEEITCSKPIRHCAAAGAVTVQIGREQLEGTAVELDVSLRKLVVTRDPTVERTF